jgi:hypothetical protein
MDPELIEPGVKYFLHQSLKQCHLAKEGFYNIIFNIGMLIALLIVTGLILFYKYKGKLTPVEIEQKNKEKQQYILSKIQTIEHDKRTSQQELITGLPYFENEYETLHK